MVGLNGLEPSTSRLSGVRSNQLSYRPIIWWVWTESNRRHLELQSNALPTELQTHKKNGGPDRDRTGDLLRDRQAC